MTITSTVYAKINISLDIISKRSDGYHNLKTIMQSINLCDKIVIRCIPGEDIKVSTNLAYIPDDTNIAAKAASIFFTFTGIKGYSTNIQIEKKIPVGAGLGGGSTDAAGVLVMLDSLFDTRLGRKKLEELAEKIGADVPFCIKGGTQLAQGIGEKLTDLPSIPESYIVVCKPLFSCSTPELFSQVKCEKLTTRPDTDGLIKALSEGSINDIARRMYNVFEDVIGYGKTDIDSIKNILLDYGALGAIMTGSGPAVFGLFDTYDKAEIAFRRLNEKYSECFLAKTIDTASSIIMQEV